MGWLLNVVRGLLNKHQTTFALAVRCCEVVHHPFMINKNMRAQWGLLGEGGWGVWRSRPKDVWREKIDL